MASLEQQLASAARALGEVCIEGLDRVPDAELLQLVAASALNERTARAHSAVLAGELARRSAPEFGHDGLAQRSGHRTPQKLIQATTGATSRDAAQAIRVGGLAQTHPWLAAVAQAVADHRVSTDAADSIRAGLGAPSESVSAESLAEAARRLADESESLDADRVFLRAREARDELDAAGIVDRERAAREARELRLQRLRDGSVRVVWQLDPIEGSVISEVYDRATSPRRGGPRFVSDADRAQQIADDPRSTEQLASDVFFHLITAGAEVRPEELLGRGAPAVRVTITEKQLVARTDVADGVLLCKHHHLLLHDHHWEIERRGPARDEFWLIPPPDHPEPHPRLMLTKSLGLRDLLAG